MLNIEKVSTLQNSIPILAKTDGEQFLHQFAELTAQTLGIYFVGIYMVDETKEYLVLQAGSGVRGERLCKSGFKERINPSLLNCAAAVYHEEVILVEWLERIKISSYSIGVNNICESKSELLPPDFLCSPVLPQARTELHLPLRVSDKIIGVLELNFDKHLKFGIDEIARLQMLANKLALAAG